MKFFRDDFHDDFRDDLFPIELRPSGGGGISNAIKPSQKLSRAAAATQHFCGGTNYIADIKGPTRIAGVNLIGWPNNAGGNRAFQ